jgi:branched-subunit amino acid transport protein AzlD
MPFELDFSFEIIGFIAYANLKEMSIIKYLEKKLFLFLLLIFFCFFSHQMTTILEERILNHYNELLHNNK